MLNFEFLSPTRFVFGRQTQNEVGRLLKEYGAKKVLLHYGKGSVVRTKLLDTVKASLNASGVEFVELGGVQPNPLLSLIIEGIEICKTNNVDFILCLGGGSVIDSGKLIAVGASQKEDIKAIWRGEVMVKSALKIGVVLTIAAAGSEGSLSAVATDDQTLLKQGIKSDLVRPTFAIMNPELLVSVPAYQNACGIADILAHIFERYFSKTEEVELTDRICEALVKVVIERAERFVANPSDYDAAADIMWAGMLAHNNICGVGRVQDWASHRMEHQFSSLYDLAHGAGLAIIMPAWMRFVLPNNQKRFARIGRFSFDIQESDDSRAGEEFIARLSALYKRIGLPSTFGEAGISEEQIRAAVEKTPLENGGLGAFERLTKQDILSTLLSVK